MFPPLADKGLFLYGLVTSLLAFLIREYTLNLVVFTVCLKIFISTRKTTHILVVLLILATVRRWYNSPQNAPKQKKTVTAIDPGPLRPLIFPCRTTHTRLFPKKHALSYNYLQCGIPIGWQGNNAILGVDNGQQTPWLSIRAADYLARGQEGSSLNDKLATYLLSQGESLKDYAHVYLVTAPRFLGYAFNPVSFWYLFSSDLRLEAMILEVNNTFDERRIYFMKRSNDTDVDAAGEELKFTHTWSKDFHVSPFNSRKGDYSLAAVNPFISTKDSNPRIDNVITLKSSKGHAKIVARIFSTSPAIDPTNMKAFDTARLLSSWFFTGFLTFPRILKEAAILFFKHKLHVWYRPEVVKTSIGRRTTTRERLIETIFQSFLREQISHSAVVKSLEYIPPSGSASDVLHFTSNLSTKETNIQKITLQILTPQFYTDIVTSNPAEYILNSADKPVELQTFTTNSHKDLAELLVTSSRSKNYSGSIVTSIRARILSILRRKSKDTHILDVWVIRSDTLSEQQKNTYFSCATALIVANRGLAGFDNVLDWTVQAMQAGLIWKVTGLILDSRYITI